MAVLRVNSLHLWLITIDLYIKVTDDYYISGDSLVHSPIKNTIADRAVRRPWRGNRAKRNENFPSPLPSKRSHNRGYILRSQSLAWPDGKYFRLATPVAARTVCSAKAPQTSGWAAVNTLHSPGRWLDITNG